MTQQQLLDIGFTYIGSCNCNGSHNKKYKRSEYLIYITKSQFRVKKNGATIKGYSDIEGLEKYLQAALQILPSREQIQGNTSV